MIDQKKPLQIVVFFCKLLKDELKNEVKRLSIFRQSYEVFNLH